MPELPPVRNFWSGIIQLDLPGLLGRTGALTGCAISCLAMIEILIYWQDSPLIPGTRSGISPITALTIIVLSVALFRVLQGAGLLPRLLAGVALFVSLLAALDWAGVIQIAPVHFGIHDSGVLPPLSPNGVMAILFCALALLILSFTGLSRVQIGLALVSAFLGAGISALSLYGYLIGAQQAYWWYAGRDMAPSAAAALLCVGLGSVAAVWTRINTPVSESREIVRGIQVTSGAVLFITILLSGAVVLGPLYETLLRMAYEQTKHSVEAKRAELSLFLSSLEVVAVSVALDYESRNYGRIVTTPVSPEEVVSPEQLKRMTELMPRVHQFTFHPVSGDRAGFGLVPPVSSNAADRSPFWRRSIRLTFGKDHSGRVWIAVEMPVVGLSRLQLGMLRAEIDNGYLLGLFSRDMPVTSRRGSFFLLPHDGGGEAHLLKMDLDANEISTLRVQAGPKELLTALAADHVQEVSPSQALLSRSVLSFLYPLEGAHAHLGFVSRVAPVRALFQERLVQIGLGLLVLACLASGFIYLLTRKLGRQIVLLQDEVSQSMHSLATELVLRKEAQAEIQRSLEEKEVLLKEIHHRVKNNLQVISSILNLQLRRTENPEIETALRDSSLRVQSIALLHETLYRSQNFASIDLSTYLSDLVRHLMSSYSLRDKIGVEVKAEGITLELDRAIPLGLILTELLTNSFKYAFPSSRINAEPPSIVIQVARPHTGRMEFYFADNGVGLPEDFSFDRSKTLGARLIATLSRQLRGEMVLLEGQGTRFKISFSVEPNISEESDEKTKYSYC